jgi:Methyltransferase domain
MTTLTTNPLAPLLDRLFEGGGGVGGDGGRNGRSLRRRAGAPDAEQDRLPRPLRAAEERSARRLARDRRAALLLARGAKAPTIVEFGTSFGISTLCLAAALRDNGGGRLITTEFEASKVARARENLTVGGLIDLVELREGDALKTLKVDLPRDDRPPAPRRRQGALSRRGCVA